MKIKLRKKDEIIEIVLFSYKMKKISQTDFE